MKFRHFKFGLLILLAFSLQVSFALAAQNWCPWMQAPMDMPSQTAAAEGGMPECEGMSEAGMCHLQPICSAVPVLNQVALLAQEHPLPIHAAATPKVDFASVFLSPPENIPIL